MKKISSYIICVSLLIGFQSCQNGFEELNKNPFSPTEVLDGPLFNEIISSLRLGHNRQLYVHNEKLYNATQQGALTAEIFPNVTIGTEDLWQNYYRALGNARELERRFSEEIDDPEIVHNVKAQVRIIMAYKTFTMTDLFGDIPYFDAGKAFDDIDNLRVAFDDQEEIYKSLIEDLEWASKHIINAGNPVTASGNAMETFGEFDTFFNNNWSKWIKFSNSLQLRYLMRVYEKDPEYVIPKISELLSSGASFLATDEDIVMHPREQNWDNWGVNWSFREHNKLRLGTTMWNFMTENNDVIDPRLNIFFETNNEDKWVPFPQTNNDNAEQSGGEPYQPSRRDASYFNKGQDNIYANFNYYLIRDNQDIPEIIMTSAEVKFLLAEIFLRGIGTPSDVFLADFNYNLGMFDSQKYWQNTMLNSSIWINNRVELSTGILATVYNHPRYNFMMADSDETRLKMIYAQRWVDSFRQPWEAFSLLRRTNSIPREGDDNQLFRLQYPPSERNNNAENWGIQASKMGADEENIPVWWMTE